jgi:hypothetical protein
VRAGWGERLRALVQVAPVLGVFVVVIVGIYGGWANPTEAAAIGAAACGVLAVATGGMRTKGLLDSALGTAQATAMIFVVLLGADMLNTALALSQMPVRGQEILPQSGAASSEAPRRVADDSLARFRSRVLRDPLWPRRLAPRMLALNSPCRAPRPLTRRAF